MKIIIETEFEKFITEFTNMDVSLDQIFSAIIGMLVGCTWDIKTIKEYLRETYGETYDKMEEDPE